VLHQVGVSFDLYIGHVLIECELANNMLFDHEPWELNDCFGADRSKIMITSTLPICESKAADSDARGHTVRKDIFSRGRKKTCSFMNKVVAKITTLRL